MQTHTQDKEIHDMTMTAAETLIEQGEIQAMQESVIKLIRHRFEEVSDSIISKLRQTGDISYLDTLFDQILEASSLDDIDLPNK